MQVLSGRYGPYVKHGDVNATLPRGKEPAALTMDEAVLLIAERAAKGPSKKQGPAARPPRRSRRREAGAAKSRRRPKPRRCEASKTASAKKAKGKAARTREAAE